MLITVGLTAFAYRMELETLLNQLQSIENRENDIVVERIRKQFTEIIGDLYILAELSSTRKFANSANVTSLDELESDFSNLAKRKKIYQKISYIDTEGEFIAGVQYNETLDNASLLKRRQSNPDVDVYEDTKSIFKNQVYVSSFDMTIENTNSAIPHIKFAIGVYDDNNSRKGIVILDYMGDKLLELMDQYSFYENRSENFILNRDGESLKVSQSLRQKILEKKSPEKIFFKKVFPEEWEKMTDASSGDFFSVNGFYVYTTFFPLLEIYKAGRDFENFALSEQGGMDITKYSWKLVSHIPVKSMNFLKFNIIKKYTALDFSLLAIIALILWILADESMNKKIAEKNLMLQNEELKKANDMKDKFFSIIAHDLKTPFTGLLGLMEILMKKQGNLSEERKERFLKEIYRTLKHTYNLLENLLQWSRLQTQNIDFSPTELKLKELLQDTVSLLLINASRKDIVISMDVADEKVVYGDSKMLQVIFRNILSNAIKYTGREGNIQISAISNDGEVEISIKDNGIGMSREILSRIFDKNTKYSTLGTENEIGTGLGLILVKEFLRRNNGRIIADSEVGNGTEFKITLPAKRWL
jgi:signal transduction histidine kinase